MESLHKLLKSLPFPGGLPSAIDGICNLLKIDAPQMIINGPNLVVDFVSRDFHTNKLKLVSQILLWKGHDYQPPGFYLQFCSLINGLSVTYSRELSIIEVVEIILTALIGSGRIDRSLSPIGFSGGWKLDGVRFFTLKDISTLPSAEFSRMSEICLKILGNHSVDITTRVNIAKEILFYRHIHYGNPILVGAAYGAMMLAREDNWLREKCIHF